MVHSMPNQDSPDIEDSDRMNLSDVRDEAPIGKKINEILSKGIDKVKNPHPDLSNVQYQEFVKKAKHKF